MTTITTNDGTEIFYKDWGSRDAQVIHFHHGWPLSSDDWDAQMMFFLAKGYRVVAHDLVVQRVEAVAGLRLRFRVQRRLQFLDAFRS